MKIQKTSQVDIKINFTKKEYRLLLEMLYLADWVMESHNVDCLHVDHSILRNKILSSFIEMGAEDIIDHADTDGEHYETQEFEMLMHEEFIKPYNTETFWGELANRLSMRDLMKKVGPEKFQSMDNMERFLKLGELSDEYNEEFWEHGLERIVIDHASLIKS